MSTSFGPVSSMCSSLPGSALCQASLLHNVEFLPLYESSPGRVHSCTRHLPRKVALTARALATKNRCCITCSSPGAEGCNYIFHAHLQMYLSQELLQCLLILGTT